MSPLGHAWNEAKLSEAPAVEALAALGFNYVARESLEAERLTLNETVRRP